MSLECILVSTDPHPPPTSLYVCSGLTVKMVWLLMLGMCTYFDGDVEG